MNLNQLVERGHFTKVFDPGRSIPAEQFNVLIKLLHSIPASVNAQTGHYIVASDLQSKSRVASALGPGAEINAPKVMNASHVIVFATRENLTDEYLDEIYGKEIADGKFLLTNSPNAGAASYATGLISGVSTPRILFTGWRSRPISLRASR